MGQRLGRCAIASVDNMTADSLDARRPLASSRIATVTLRDAAFAAACADLMLLVECEYQPTLLVGVRTGGFVVAGAMARAASSALPVLPLTCRRPGTKLKSRLPGLKTILTALPGPLLDAMRRMEHRLLSRRRHARLQEVDSAEAAAIGAFLANAPSPPRLLVADDAVDSGMTLAAVLRALHDVCPPGTELRTAVITMTLPHPAVVPDFALFKGVLCRFPWSFDTAG